MSTTTTLYGFSLSMARTSVFPNCAAALRAHASGTFSSLCFEIGSFVKAKAKLTGLEGDAVENVPLPAIDDIVNEVAGMTVGMLESLIERGLKARCLEITPMTLSFVPCGWICAERSSSNDGQIYGCRKSVFIKNAENAASYLSALHSFEAANKRFAPTMKEIHRMMGA